MKIAVAGSGYVGLSLSLLISQYHEVITYDIDETKVNQINQNKSPIDDSEINEFFQNNILIKYNLEIQSDNEFNINNIMNIIQSSNISCKLISRSSFNNKHSINIAIFLKNEKDISIVSDKLNEDLKLADFYLSRV